MKAQPGPIVSGNHFFPKAPLLCVNRIPDCAVMSTNVMVCAGAIAAHRKINTNHRKAGARRKTKGRNLKVSPCLRVSIVDSSAEERITGQPPNQPYRQKSQPGACERALMPPTVRSQAAQLTRAREYSAARCCLQD